MSREAREFELVISVRERSARRRVVGSWSRRSSYVLARVSEEDEQRYLGPYLCTELAKLFADTCVTLVTDETIK